MEIKLEGWKEEMFKEMYGQLPDPTQKVLEEVVKFVGESTGETIGDGHYKDGYVTFSPVRHPRYLIEMVTFLMGCGIDEKITPDSLGSGARIFALGVLYPRNLLNRVLSDQFYQEIARKYQIEVFGGKFPDINTEALVSKYVPKARNEIQELKDEAYKKIEEEWFDREARGFLIRPRRF